MTGIKDISPEPKRLSSTFAEAVFWLARSRMPITHEMAMILGIVFSRDPDVVLIALQQERG